MLLTHGPLSEGTVLACGEVLRPLLCRDATHDANMWLESAIQRQRAHVDSCLPDELAAPPELPTSKVSFQN